MTVATQTPIKSVDEIFNDLKNKLGNFNPDFELEIKAKLAHEILQLKRDRNAVILGHNYMEPALFHSVPDIVGDSLALSRAAAETEADVIVFCGVEFMAETAKILNPTKTVLIPSQKAGCSLAESITAEDVRNLRKKYPGVPIVGYINTYADVKAELDVCCTSGNAVRVVESFGTDKVIFVPDEYLARNVAAETGKHIIFPTLNPADVGKQDPELDYELVGWKGKCEVHDKFTVEDIEMVRSEYPDVVILAHPECKPEVVAASDFSGSTSQMINYVETVEAPKYLLLTECAMGDNIAAENPHRDMLRLCSVRCPYMNQIQLQDTRDALLYNQYQVEIDEEIRLKALRSVQRMLEI